MAIKQLTSLRALDLACTDYTHYNLLGHVACLTGLTYLDLCFTPVLETHPRSVASFLRRIGHQLRFLAIPPNCEDASISEMLGQAVFRYCSNLEALDLGDLSIPIAPTSCAHVPEAVQSSGARSHVLPRCLSIAASGNTASRVLMYASHMTSLRSIDVDDMHASLVEDLGTLPHLVSLRMHRALPWSSLQMKAIGRCTRLVHLRLAEGKSSRKGLLPELYRLKELATLGGTLRALEVPALCLTARESPVLDSLLADLHMVVRLTVPKETIMPLLDRDVHPSLGLDQTRVPRVVALSSHPGRRFLTNQWRMMGWKDIHAPGSDLTNPWASFKSHSEECI